MAFAEIFSRRAFGTKVEKNLVTAKGAGLSLTENCPRPPRRPLEVFRTRSFGPQFLASLNAIRTTKPESR